MTTYVNVRPNSEADRARISTSDRLRLCLEAFLRPESCDMRGLGGRAAIPSFATAIYRDIRPVALPGASSTEGGDDAGGADAVVDGDAAAGTEPGAEADSGAEAGAHICLTQTPPTPAT